MVSPSLMHWFLSIRFYNELNKCNKWQKKVKIETKINYSTLGIQKVDQTFKFETTLHQQIFRGYTNKLRHVQRAKGTSLYLLAVYFVSKSWKKRSFSFFFFYNRLVPFLLFLDLLYACICFTCTKFVIVTLSNFCPTRALNKVCKQDFCTFLIKYI